MTKDNFNLYDFIAVGVVNEEGSFTADMLNRIYNITSEIEEIEGVIVEDIMAPSTVDDIKQGPGGMHHLQDLRVRFPNPEPGKQFNVIQKAAIAPAKNCPSAPILNILALNAITTARPV